MLGLNSGGKNSKQIMLLSDIDTKALGRPNPWFPAVVLVHVNMASNGCRLVFQMV